MFHLKNQADCGMAFSYENYFREVSERESPHLHAAVKELSEKAGIAVPKIWFTKNYSDLGGAAPAILHNIGAALPNHTIAFGQGLRDLVGHSNAGSTISEEFKGVLAHEIAHLKNKDLQFGIPLARMSPLVGMLLAVGGLAAYRHYHKLPEKAHDAPKEEPPEMRQTAAVADVHAPDATHKFLEALITSAKYIGAGLAGLTAGVFISRFAHHKIEFRADRTAAGLIGDGKGLARALEIFGEEWIEKPLRSMADQMRKTGSTENQIKNKEGLHRWLVGMQHPKIIDRVERLNSWTPGR